MKIDLSEWEELEEQIQFEKFHKRNKRFDDDSQSKSNPKKRRRSKPQKRFIPEDERDNDEDL